MTPAATESAVLPAFIFMAGCALVAGLAYRVLPIETHGRALTLTGDVPMGAAGSARALKETPGLAPTKSL